MEGFKYIVKKQKPAKVCFGSTRVRDLSRKGASSFMRHYVIEDYPKITPGSYNAQEAFKAIKDKPYSLSISKKGYSGLARFATKIVHHEDYPSPCSYNVAQTKTQNYHPPTYARKKQIFTSSTPGPGMYNVPKKYGITYEHNFGGRVKMCLGVKLKCCCRNTDHCKICGLKPVGDYWHYNNKSFLCRECMNNENQNSKFYTKNTLKNFQKIRDCSRIHLHKDTVAKIWLMHPKDIVQWMRREAYVAAYIEV